MLSSSLVTIWNESFEATNSLKDQETLIGDSVIVGCSRECRDEAARPDPIAYLFSRLFEDLNLIDVKPHKIFPTYRNSKRTRTGISKR